MKQYATRKPTSVTEGHDERYLTKKEGVNRAAGAEKHVNTKHERGG